MPWIIAFVALWWLASRNKQTQGIHLVIANPPQVQEAAMQPEAGILTFSQAANSIVPFDVQRGATLDQLLNEGTSPAVLPTVSQINSPPLFLGPPVMKP